jgi:acyl-CoA thioester hydrolase
MTKNPDLADVGLYHHWADDVVRFCDTDQAGHVNNVAIAAYVETGRLLFDRQVIEAVAEGLEGEEFRAILANLTVNYLAESFWPGTVRVGTRLIRIGSSSLTTAHGVFREDGRCIATATCVLVNRSGGRSAPMGPVTRERLAALLP